MKRNQSAISDDYLSINDSIDINEVQILGDNLILDDLESSAALMNNEDSGSNSSSGSDDDGTSTRRNRMDSDDEYAFNHRGRKRGGNKDDGGESPAKRGKSRIQKRGTGDSKDEDGKSDAGYGLSFPKQALASETITNSVLTPFDQSNYIEILSHPLKVGEMITVQIVYQNVKPTNESSKPNVELIDTCPEGHQLKLKPLQKKKTKQKEVTQWKCYVCDKKFSMKRNFCRRCDECGQQDKKQVGKQENEGFGDALDKLKLFPTSLFDSQPGQQNQIQGVFNRGHDWKPEIYGYCADCYAKHFVRRQLKDKTYWHHTYTKSKLIEGSDSNGLQIEKDGECDEDVHKYALISFWHQNPTRMNCYRVFRIDNPRTIKKDGLSQRKFLFHSQDKTHLFCVSGLQDNLILTTFNLDDKTPASANPSSKEQSPKDKANVVSGNLKNQVANDPEDGGAFDPRKELAQSLLYQLGGQGSLPNPESEDAPCLQHEFALTGDCLHLVKRLFEDQKPKNQATLSLIGELLILNSQLHINEYGDIDIDEDNPKKHIFVMDLRQEQTIQIQCDIELFNFNALDMTAWTMSNRVISKLEVSKDNSPVVLKEWSLFSADASKASQFANFIESSTVGAFELSSNQSQVTIIFANNAVFVFKLEESKANLKFAEILMDNKNKPLPRLINKEQLLVVDNFKPQKPDDKRALQATIQAQAGIANTNTTKGDEQQTSFKKWQLSVCDINPNELSKKVKNLQDIQPKEYELQMPHEIVYGSTKYEILLLQGQDNSVHIVVTYQIKNQIKCCLVQAGTKQPPLFDEQPVNQELSPQMLSQNEYIVQFPLLIYAGPSPMRNQLAIVNLAVDKPQTYLDIFPYRLLSFVSYNSELIENGKLKVHFLAQNSNNDVVFMRYEKTFWQDGDEAIFIQNPKLSLPKEIVLDRIKSAVYCKINRKECIFVQTHSVQNLILTFFFDSWNQPVMIQDQEIQPLKMVYDSQNNVYTVIKDQNNEYQVWKSVFQYAGEVQWLPIYKSTVPILAIQMSNSNSPCDLAFDQLLLLDAEMKMHLICDGQAKELCVLPRTTSVRNLAAQLKNVQYPSLVLSAEQIIACHVTKQACQYTGIRTACKFEYNQEFLRFHENESHGPSKGNFSNTVDIQPVSQISKNVFVVQEAFCSYFLIQKSPDVSWVELVDRTFTVDKVEIVGRVILVYEQEKCYVFDQRTMLLQRVIHGAISVRSKCEEAFFFMQKIKQVAEIADASDGEQLITERQFVPKKTEFRNDLFKYYYSGDMEPQLLKSDVKKQMKAIENDFFVKPVNPAYFHQTYFVTAEGRLVQVLVGGPQQGDEGSVMKGLMIETDLDANKNVGSQKKAQVDKNTDVESYFVLGKQFLRRQSNAKSDLEPIQCALTADYIIVGTRKQVFCVEKKQIKQKITFFQRNVERLQNIKPITIDLKILFEKETLEWSYKINEVSDCDKAFLQKGQIRSANMIQITTGDYLLVWDIDRDKEVSTLAGYTQFLSHDNFVPTGHTLYQNFEATNANAYPVPVTHNESYDLFCIPGEHREDNIIIRRCSELNMRYMIWLDERLTKELKIESDLNPNMQFVLSDCFATSMFDYFSDYPKFAQFVQHLYSNTHLDSHKLSNNVEFDHIYKRRLHKILNYPSQRESKLNKFLQKVHVQRVDRKLTLNSFCESKKKDAEVLTCIMKQLESKKKNFKYIDTLLELLLLSRETSLSQIVTEFKYYENLQKMLSPTIEKFFANCFVQSTMIQQEQNMVWETDKSMITFGSNTAQLSVEEITARNNQLQDTQFSGEQFVSMLTCKSNNKQTDNEETKQTQEVTIQIIELSWINNQIADLYVYLDNEDNLSNYNSELIKVLILEQDYFQEIFWRAFVPYVIYMVSVLIYFSHIMIIPEDISPLWLVEHTVCRVLIFVLTFVLLFYEGVQIVRQKLSYFKSLLNLIQMTSSFLNLGIVCVHASGIEYDVMVMTRAASVGVFMLWLIVMSWMRLFDGTSFYYMMITEALNDSKYFLFMILLCLCMFGNAVLVLDDKQIALSDYDYEEYEIVVPVLTWYRFTDALISQYMIGLGNIDYSAYLNNEALGLMWFYLILATIITQLVFMNILIAIISDTYERITERRVTYAMMQKTKLYADYIQSIRKDKKMSKNAYLYVIRPVATNEDEGEWSGAFNSLKTMILQKFVKLEKHNANLAEQLKVQTADRDKLNKSIELIQNKLDKLQPLSDSKVELMQQRVLAMWTASNDLVSKQSEMENKLMSKLKNTDETLAQKQKLVDDRITAMQTTTNKVEQQQTDVSDKLKAMKETTDRIETKQKSEREKIDQMLQLTEQVHLALKNQNVKSEAMQQDLKLVLNKNK